MPPVKPILFTVHGIYTDGRWQAGAASVLDPFFLHHPLKYEANRRWAIVKLGADVFLTLFWCGLAIFLIRLGVPLNWWIVVLYLLIASAGVIAAHQYGKAFRVAVMTMLYETMSEIIGNGYAPSKNAISICLE